MMKKKEIQNLLDNHISIGNDLTKTRKDIIKQDLDFRERRSQLEDLAYKEELNDFAISLLKKILQ